MTEVTCVLCDRQKAFGSNRYDAKKTNIGFVCEVCRISGDLAPHQEEKIKDFLSKEAFDDLERNENGFIIIR